MVASSASLCEIGQSPAVLRQQTPEYLSRNRAENVAGQTVSPFEKQLEGTAVKSIGSTESRTFPDSSDDLNERALAKQVSDALVVDFAHYRGHHKVIARKAGASPKSAKNWLAAEHPPSLIYFLRLLPHSPSLRRLVAMDSELSPDFQRELNALIQRHIR